MQRLKEIDFLRAIAIILVLFHHYWVNDYLQNVGWIGVDLFFVLSGFLVSGLLFSEYKKFGQIKVFHFLIRRGFKIYPLFYLSLALTLIMIYFFPVDRLNWKGHTLQFLAEVFFLQNYLGGFWSHHWSLAVEEHFYIFLALLLFGLIRFKLLTEKVFVRIALFIFVVCLVLRIITVYYGCQVCPPPQATHLRMDSLFAGVMVAYFYHFNQIGLAEFYSKYKSLFFLIAFIPFTFTPFVSNDSMFIRTIGFTVLYIGFSALLFVFLFSDIGNILNRLISKTIYTAICKIGAYSYGIYLFHLYLVKFVFGEDIMFNPPSEISAKILGGFLIYFVGAITFGIITSLLIEVPMLKIRDYYFPRRSAVITDKKEKEKD